MNPNIGILIFDSSGYTRSLLVERIARLGGCFLHAYENTAAVDCMKLPAHSGVVILNHHATDPEPQAFLAALKAAQPSLHVLVITSPGNEKRSFESLRQSGQIDALLDKPIDPDALAHHAQEQVARLGTQRHLAFEHLNLLRFLPTGGLRRIFNRPEPGHAELFDMTVLFTDIRDSSRWINESSAQDYFVRLNQILGAQARLIRQYDGMVVKTTGDGLLAVFEGSARCHLALKCAQTIQVAAAESHVPVGIGLSDGLVLTGILGTHEHVHFDVIGAHVHLAARLCGLAQAGEILAAQEVVDKARFEFTAAPLTETIQVRGFAAPVPCTHIQPQSKEPV